MAYKSEEIQEKVVHLDKTARTVKGGRKFKFAVIVVAGDKKGRVGIGYGKASEVADAKEKASKDARKNLIKISLRGGRTVHHDIIGKFCSAKVVIRSALPGTGIIAGGAARAVFELLGAKDVVVKSVRSSNPHNMIKALILGLTSTMSPKLIAEKRRKKISDILGTKESALN